MADPLQEWLATRPESVRRLAAEFPAGTPLGLFGDPVVWVIGWTEDDMLIVSPVDPGTDYDGALAAKRYICAAHLREPA